jgi:hypothetical protein
MRQAHVVQERITTSSREGLQLHLQSLAEQPPLQIEIGSLTLRKDTAKWLSK